jgi:hypothetical protein
LREQTQQVVAFPIIDFERPAAALIDLVAGR